MPRRSNSLRSRREARRATSRAGAQDGWSLFRVPLPPLALLDEAGLERIEAVAFRVLEELGLEFQNPAALDVLARHGAHVDFHIAGPKARELFARLTDRDVGGNALPFLSAFAGDVGPCPEAVCIRVSFTGELGYELHAPMAYLSPLLDAVLEAGRDLRLRLAGSRALMWLRLEKSWPSWGLELSSDTTPFEPGLDRFVRWGKGDFVGREAALAARDEGVTRERLATLVVDADGADCWGGESVFRDGAYIGYVTSGGFGPCVNESLALGYLRADAFEEGARVEILLNGDRRPARVTTRARFDPEGVRMRA